VWQADLAALTGHEQKVAWRTGDLGEHTFNVTVESPWGTKKTASTTVEVRLTSYAYPLMAAGNMESPAPTHAKKELPYEIADVWVEKDEVCQGEPSRIRVSAKDKRGQEKWLTPVIDGKEGWEEPFIVPISDPGMHKVSVALTDPRLKGSNMVETSVFILVKDCVAPRPLFMQHKMVPGPDDSYIALEARIFDGPGWQRWNKQGLTGPPPLTTAASYKWTFGDGQTETSTDNIIRHHYPNEMDRGAERTTLYAASVDAFDASGNKLATGYETIELANRLRTLKLEHGLLQLATQQGPVGQQLPDGSRYVDVTLINIDPVETARLTELAIHYKRCDKSDTPETAASLQSVFADPRIPPKGRIQGRMIVPKDQAEDICWADARVAGESEPGQFKVAGFFALDAGNAKGAAVPVAAASTLKNALQLLGKDRDQPGTAIITDAEIRRLEDEGKIPRNVLRPDPFAAPRPGQPPPIAPH